MSLKITVDSIQKSLLVKYQVWKVYQVYQIWILKNVKQIFYLDLKSWQLFLATL